MIDFELIDAPICFSEGTRVILDEVVASRSLGCAGGILVVEEWATRIITTKIDVHDNVLIVKIVIEPAVGDEFRKR